MNEDEMIWDLEKYVSLMEAEYCDECNELNVISGKFCNGSRNVGLAVKTILDLYNKQKNIIDLMAQELIDQQVRTFKDNFDPFKYINKEQVKKYFEERCK